MFLIGGCNEFETIACEARQAEAMLIGHGHVVTVTAMRSRQHRASDCGHLVSCARFPTHRYSLAHRPLPVQS